MRNNRHARATIIIVTIAIAAVLTSLFVATMTIAPRQADALSIYDPDAANPDTSEEKIEQPLEQDDYATTTTTTPTVSCAMDTIESFQSFLSCLGAK
jgi:hypothetical protein